MELNICHLYPDALNLYGDRGNILCLQKRLQWRGINATVTPLRVDESADLTRFDLYFIGGGQDFEQEVLLADLAGGKAENLRAAAKDGKTFLGICGGYQMLGHSYTTKDGIELEYLGIADCTTIGGPKRMIGNLAFQCSDDGVGMIAGFENHSGQTRLGGNAMPLGYVLRGFGNNGEDGTEGVHQGNVFGTYSHGPVLPKNPALCDLILLTALREKYGCAELSPLNDEEELLVHDAAIKMMFR